MESSRFLEDLAIAIVAAAIGGGSARWLKLNPILGYLVAGIAIGPFTPGYSADTQTISNLASIGVIFLLFGIGLGFSPSDLRARGRAAALTNVVTLPVIGLAIGATAFAFHSSAPVTFALISIVSSTAVGAAILRDRNLQESPSGKFAITVLIAQDLAAVLLLVAVGTPASSLSLAGVAIALVRVILFVVGALLIGAYVLPKIFVRLMRDANSETLVITFAGVALLSALGASVAGLSYAFGAFIAGAVISEAAGSRMVQTVVAPFRDLLTSLFYVSVGMLVNPRIFTTDWKFIVTIAAVAIVVRLFGWFGAARLVRLPAAAALTVGIAMVPLGEFNVVLAQVASAAGRLARPEFNEILGIVVVSIIAAIVLASITERIRFGQSDVDVFVGKGLEVPVAIVGYGRVGRTVAGAFHQLGTPYAVLERDRIAVESAKSTASVVVVGDGADPLALDAVVSGSTRLVVSTIPDAAANIAILHRVSGRKGIAVIARAANVDEVQSLLSAGARSVIVPEVEGSFAFAETALREVNTTETDIRIVIQGQRDALLGTGAN